MAKKDTAAQAPAKKKKNAVEAKPFTEAPRLKVKYTDEIVNQLKLSDPAGMKGMLDRDWG